jgi:hypothetical protein
MQAGSGSASAWLRLPAIGANIEKLPSSSVKGASLRLTVAPAFSQHGGNVVGGFRLAITAPAGEIRYTLDGSDPREIGGAVAAGARAYSGEITLNQSTTVRARVVNAGSWSPLIEASFTLIQTFDTLRVTEIHYHPSADGVVDGDAFEFVELKNVGADTLDLSGVRCVDGIDYTFPLGTRLEPGRWVVLVSDAEAFARRYPGVAVGGVYQGRLCIFSGHNVSAIRGRPGIRYGSAL